LSAFNTEGVDFLLVGAYALAAHGLPRATGDMDTWIRCSDDNARRVWHALQRFGAPLTDVILDDFKTPNTAFQIGVAPHRVDILMSIDGFEFDDAWPQRLIVEIEGHTLAVLSRAHLLQNK